MPASAQMTVEDQIEARQAAYQFMSWNMGKIKAQAVDGEVEFNADQMKAAANAIAQWPTPAWARSTARIPPWTKPRTPA